MLLELNTQDNLSQEKNPNFGREFKLNSDFSGPFHRLRDNTLLQGCRFMIYSPGNFPQKCVLQ